jgi:hypothetical protein
VLPREPRMDGVLVRDPAGNWWVREGRRVKAGDAIVSGLAEDGSEGVLVHARGFQRRRARTATFTLCRAPSPREAD